MKRTLLLCIVLVGIVAVAYAVAATTPRSSRLSPSQATTLVLGAATKSVGCQAQGSLQDTACTPGAVFPGVTVQQVCTRGYATSVRNVPQAEKQNAFAEYGVASHPTGSYEVDHLISLELGGSNDIANLWPEAASPPPGFHQKDAVENYLHAQVCSGAIPLQQAQREIASNWLSVYRQINPGG